MLLKSISIKLPPGWLHGGLIVILSLWILHSFLEALLAACVTAIASWPLYARFCARVPWRLGRAGKPLIFTLLVTGLVLAPMMFAFGALLHEANVLIEQVAAADRTGLSSPAWLGNVPVIGRWLDARWEFHLARPGFFAAFTQGADTGALLGWAGSLGQFMVRHAFIVGFAILLLYFLYQQGEWLVRGVRRVLRERIGERTDAYIDLAGGAVRASVNSMLVVALFDGFATGIAYAIAGVPHAAMWGAITGLLALLPFVAYGAVVALALQLTMTAGATNPLLAFGLGYLVLICGDKILRPVVARDGMRLPFVWVLMGCLGGFEVLGLVGVVVGPVVLTLARELWEQRVCDLALARGEQHSML